MLNDPDPEKSRRVMEAILVREVTEPDVADGDATA
jgi:hypothetical protein